MFMEAQYYILINTRNMNAINGNDTFMGFVIQKLYRHYHNKSIQKPDVEQLDKICGISLNVFNDDFFLVKSQKRTSVDTTIEYLLEDTTT